MTEEQLRLLKNFLDEDGRVKAFPAKHAAKYAVYAYVAEKVEPGRDYTEKEINALINEWHTFGDYFIIRRGMVEADLVKRVPSGARYWREIPSDADNGSI